ncbi:MAG: hypothetical protein ACJ74Y_17955, partial [Bryobacteraceae bacterium]
MDQVRRTIRLASRRHLWVEGAAQFGLAVCLAMAGLILLLVCGTNIFEWYWPALLLVGGLAAGILRLRQRALSDYRLAQHLDRKLALSDSLSTAQYFSDHPVPGYEDAIRYQLKQAEDVARTVHVESAFPFQAQRIWAVASGLAVVSFGLLGLRYLVTNSLNLHPPLVSFQIAPVVEQVERALGKKKDESSKLLTQNREAPSLADSTGAQELQREGLPPQVPGAESEGAKSARANAADSLNRAERAKDEAHRGGEARDSQSAKGQSGDKAPGDNNSPSKPQSGDQAKEQSGKEAKSSDGLINRMKDALSSLAAKMQPNQNQQGQQGQS